MSFLEIWERIKKLKIFFKISLNYCLLMVCYWFSNFNEIYSYEIW